MSMKTCVVCGKRLEENEDNFYKKGGRLEGFENKCKQCKHDYYIAHQEERVEYQKMYEANKRELGYKKVSKKRIKGNKINNKLNNKRVLIKNESITYARNPKVIDEAKKLANYKCEIDCNHNYVQQEDGREFVHGHHLIPFAYQDNFENNLDVVENICVLCVVDHNILHHGKAEDKIALLGRLYYKKIDGLRRCGLDITFEELLKMYNIL